MRIQVRSYIEQGVDKATIEIDQYTADEKTRVAKFGTFTVNLGGVFAKDAVLDGQGNVVTPAVNYSLEPINRVIDATQTNFIFTRSFPKTVDMPIPGLAASVFCETNLDKIVTAAEAWKALTDQYTVDMEQMV